MTPIKIALTSLSLALSLTCATARADDWMGSNQNPPNAADENGGGSLETPTSNGDDIASDIANIADGDAIAETEGMAAPERGGLFDSFFFGLDGLTWDGLESQARWAEAYVLGQVGRYDRTRYDQCLAFLADYYELLELTALIDIELETYFDEIGILTMSANDGSPTQPLSRPRSSSIDTSDSRIPNGAE